MRRPSPLKRTDASGWSLTWIRISSRPLLGVPDPHGAGEVGRRHARAVRAEARGEHDRVRAGMRKPERAAAGDVPDPREAVSARADDPSCVAVEAGSEDRGGRWPGCRSRTAPSLSRTSATRPPYGPDRERAAVGAEVDARRKVALQARDDVARAAVRGGHGDLSVMGGARDALAVSG